jgi:predicted nucleotidyltransferase
MLDANYHLLLAAARLLEPLLDDLVFVGGCATGLMITDEAAPGVRPTVDVDAIAEITSYAEYVNFADRLRAIGFSEDTSEGSPVCRWQHGEVKLDVMPLDEKILGFSNRWYKSAMQASNHVSLESALEIRVVTAPYFLATKLEAFKGRGGGDYFASRDLAGC